MRVRWGDRWAEVRQMFDDNNVVVVPMTVQLDGIKAPLQAELHIPFGVGMETAKKIVEKINHVIWRDMYGKRFA